MIYRSEDIKTTPDGRTWLIDKDGGGNNKRIHLLSDGSYTTIEQVCQKAKVSPDTARVRLAKGNDPVKVFAKLHERRSEWRKHIKIKSRITPEEEKKKMIDDELRHLMLSFK